jgi:hypothetical protein
MHHLAQRSILAILNLEGLFAGSFFAAGSLTAFIDIHTFAPDGFLNCLLVYPLGLAHPYGPGDIRAGPVETNCCPESRYPIGPSGKAESPVRDNLCLHFVYISYNQYGCLIILFCRLQSG